MGDETFSVSGRVIDSERKRGIPDLRVEAWDADRIHDDFVGRTRTDADGRFEMTVEREYFEGLFGKRRPDHYFKVYRGDELVRDTRESVHWDVDTEEIEEVIEVSGLPTDEEFRFAFTPESPVDLYGQPDESTGATERLPAHERLTVLRGEDGWYEVWASEERTGWVRHADLPVLQRALEDFADPVGEPLVDDGELTPVYDRIESLQVDESTREAYVAYVDGLVSDVSFLNEVGRDAHRYLRGDPTAERRLVETFTGFGAAGSSRQPISANVGGGPSGPGPGPGPEAEPGREPGPGLPNPRFPGESPCLVRPEPFAEIWAALLRVARSIEQPEPDRVDAVWREYADVIEGPMRSARRLELLVSEALRGASGRDRFRTVLDRMVRQDAEPAGAPQRRGDSSDRDPIPDGAGPALPFPDPSPPDFPGNPCYAERWDRTERAVRCFCAQSYEVETITNLDRERPNGDPYVREACAGDFVAIEGRGFGADRDWGLDPRQSEVVFPGSEVAYETGEIGVPAAEYREWSNDRIVARVPEGAQSGRISIRILCEGTDVGECGLRLKIPTGHPSDRDISVPDPPTIEEVAVRSPSGEETDTRIWPACEPIAFVVRASNAESVTVADERGSTVTFPAGELGDRREIEGDTATVSDHEAETYTVTARNACHEVTESITIDRRTGIELHVSPDVVGPSASSFELTLEHYCAPSVLGFDGATVDVSADDPHGVLEGLPDTVSFGADETERTVSIDVSSGACTTIEITATLSERAREYDQHTDAQSVEIVDTPHITSVRTTGANACDSFTFEVEGHCFSPHFRGRPPEALNRVVLEGGGSRQVLDSTASSGPRITDLRTGSDPPWENMTLVCESGPRLGEHDYDVTVTHHGETSNTVALTNRTLSYPRPRILDFRPDPAEIPGGRRNEIRLNFGVEYAERVEIHSLGGPRSRGSGPLLPEGELYGRTVDTCDRFTGSHTHYTWYEHTYELKAFPLAGGSPATAEVTVTESGVPPEATGTGVSRIEIANCEWDRHTVYVFLLDYSTPAGWQRVGELDPAHDSRGLCPPPGADSVMIPSGGSFEDGHVYEIRVVDPEEGNEGFEYLEPCSGENPTDANCVIEYIGPFLGDPDGVSYTGLGPGGNAHVVWD